MIATGIIFIIIGGIILGYGTNVNNNMDIQLDSFFSNGTTNTGDSFVIIGTILIIVGAIFLITGIIKNIQQNKLSTINSMLNRNSYNNVLNDLRNKNLITQEEYENKIRNNNPKDIQRVCFFCKSDLSENEIYCHSCGKKQPNQHCPKCNYKLAENSYFCSNCGTKINSDNITKECKHCGEKIEDDCKFCIKCGAKQ